MSLPQWKGLFEWTMQHSDGTRISDMSQTTIDPDKMAWLHNVLENYIKNLVGRLKEIKTTLEEPENAESSLGQQEALLDELQEIVEDLDQAKNLHIIGGVSLLIDLLQSHQKSLRWRAAEIVATCVQNNEEVKKAFFDDGILPLVQSLTRDGDSTCQSKGWMAVSCLVRNFKPALDAFLDAGGFKDLVKTLDAEDVRLVRRGLFLLQYVIRQGLSGHVKALSGSHTRALLMKFLDVDDVDVREKTLALLSTVADSHGGRLWLTEDKTLMAKLSSVEERLSSLPDTEKEDRSLEIELLKQLTTALNKCSRE